MPYLNINRLFQKIPPDLPHAAAYNSGIISIGPASFPGRGFSYDSDMAVRSQYEKPVPAPLY